MKLFQKGEARTSLGEEALRARIAQEDEMRRQVAEAETAARLEMLHSERGSDFCSARGCKEETGLPCTYLDRRDRRCPTSWCPEHRVITHEQIYCPAHANLIEGTDNGFGFHAVADMGNQVPMLVNFITRELDEMVRGMIEAVAGEMNEAVVVEPVRFVLFGVERVRTWERSWKVVSHHGVSLRVAIAVEEAKPGAVLGKINSKVAVTLAPPWNEECPVGEQPATPEEAERLLGEFRRSLFMGLARSSTEWLEGQRREMDGAPPVVGARDVYHPQ